MGSQMSVSHNANEGDGSGIPGIQTSSNDYFGGNVAETASFASESDHGPTIQSSPSEGIGIGPVRAVVTNPGVPENKEHTDNRGDTITCVFTWTHGGHTVYLTGSFNDWCADERIPLVKAGHEFVAVQELKRGRHLYKFIVDDVWKYAPDQHTAADENGHINNIIDLTDHQPFDYQIKSELTQMRKSQFHQYIPEVSEYTSDAPQIPLLFTKTSCPASDPPPRMATPLHSVANHLYHDTMAPNVFGPHISVVATTHRWRGGDLYNVANQKHCTTVLVTLNPLFLTASAAPPTLQDYSPPDGLRGLISRQIAEIIVTPNESCSDESRSTAFA